MPQTHRAPRQLLEGVGTRRTAGAIVRQYGRRAFVLSDPIIAAQPGFEQITESLREAGVEAAIHTEVSPEVPVEEVERTVEVARRFGPDVLVAVGGGSVIDTAKVVATLLEHGGVPSDYYGEQQIPGPVMPVIAVPTTAGTGSEVTTVCVLSDPVRSLKVGISSLHLLPVAAICDPELTLTCPPRVTAFAGIDAVCHAVEAYTAALRDVSIDDLVGTIFVGKNALSDRAALEALGELGPWLARAVEDGTDLDARAAVMRGATAAGVAFGHAGTAAPHALQYPIGAATSTPHGLGVGLLLPYALAAAADQMQDELSELADTVGAGGDGEALLSWLVELRARIGVPHTLRELGVERGQLRGFAEAATGITRLLANHRGPQDADALEAILQAAWAGDVAMAS